VGKKKKGRREAACALHPLHFLVPRGGGGERGGGGGGGGGGPSRLMQGKQRREKKKRKKGSRGKRNKEGTSPCIFARKKGEGRTVGPLFEKKKEIRRGKLIPQYGTSELTAKKGEKRGRRFDVHYNPYKKRKKREHQEKGEKRTSCPTSKKKKGKGATQPRHKKKKPKKGDASPRSGNTY